MNYIDYIIIGLLLISLIRGYSRGAIVVIFDLIGFAISIGLTIFAAPYIELLVRQFLKLSDQITRVIAFLVAYLLIQIFWSIAGWFVMRLFRKLEESLVNKIAGIFVSLLYNALLLGVFLVLVMNVPLDKKYREAIEASKLVPSLVSFVDPIRPSIEKTLKTAIEEVTKFITIKPASGERLNLQISPTRLEVNPEGEQEIFDLVNQERISRGLKALQFDNQLRDVGRAHAKDMWQRKYFAHVNPDGKDPFDRINDAGIEIITAGENLALAPNIEHAHEGLMNSPGHRANILQLSFGRVGIGVITGPPYGEMVVQVFRD